MAEEVKVANIKFHSATAAGYDTNQPHFRRENVRRVEAVIEELARGRPLGRLLDLGCGTGFILKIAERHFRNIVGIDITTAMIDQIRGLRRSDILLSDAFALPFKRNSFDVCTSYSFLHHLSDYGPVLKEAYRCLKPGGAYYNDQDPNFYAFEELRKLKREGKLSPELRGEIASVEKSDLPAGGKRVSEKTAALAEYHRKMTNGIKEEDMRRAIERAGFSKVEIRYHWYLAEGGILHGVSPAAAATVDRHLRALLPISRPLFKYFGFVAIK